MTGNRQERPVSATDSTMTTDHGRTKIDERLVPVEKHGIKPENIGSDAKQALRCRISH